MVIDSYEGITKGEQAGKENNMKKHYKLEHCITLQVRPDDIGALYSLRWNIEGDMRLKLLALLVFALRLWLDHIGTCPVIRTKHYSCGVIWVAVFGFWARLTAPYALGIKWIEISILWRYHRDLRYLSFPESLYKIRPGMVLRTSDTRTHGKAAKGPVYDFEVRYFKLAK